jgi:hypothetical protein
MSDPSSSRIPTTASDLDLLRRFEPVVRFTKGEQCYPTAVESYLHRCGLWAHYPDGHEAELVPAGHVDGTTLVAPRSEPFGTILFLRLVAPMNILESAQALRVWGQHKREPGNRFRAGLGRLARVGYVARIVDGLFTMSLLLRGRVPGATAAAAEMEYQRWLQDHDTYTYYGRVVRQSGWIALQYWFFYYYNGWRSGFNGVNDHESDWEQIVLYLYEDEEGLVVPRWAAYASHDFHGDDLRRRWDDRDELDLVDGHPVVYAGAGSHASYFRPGEYQTDVLLPLPPWVGKARQALSEFWTKTLGQASRGAGQNPFRIPFVDYARGDGLSIGPEQDKQWSPVLMDPVPGWAGRYRGLWGLFARDPISGENAPAGPMYNRDGTVRAAWYDVVGFAGLDKAPPSPLERRLLSQRRDELIARQEEIAVNLGAKSVQLQELGSELKAMEGNPHLAKLHAAMGETVTQLAEEVKGLRREEATNSVLLEGLEDRLARLLVGQEDPPRSHIGHLARPATTSELRFNRLAEVWAAISTSVLVIALVILMLTGPELSQFIIGLICLAVALMVVESVLRGTFTQTVNAISVTLAVIALVILVVHFWWQIVLAAVLASGAFLLWNNLKELREELQG